MKTNFLFVLGLVLVPAAGVAQTPIPLNTVPSRIVGHPLPETLTVRSSNPNLVEGREFYSPEGVALDTSVSPPILYVSDPGNNRVLAWKNALNLANNPKADLVIGQQDAYHTSPQGPSGTFQSGLDAPNGIVVDGSGNLYVADTFNNRVLRYPTPFQQYAQHGSVFPDMWVGQPSLSSSSANFGTGSVNDQGLNLAASALPVNIALDSQNNLWVVDAGNRRVLEFTAANLIQAQQSGFSNLHASLEIGQLDFSSNTLAGPSGTTTLNIPNAFATPVAIAFDASGNLFVSDYSTSYSLGRVLVFQPPFTNKQSAVRIMGVPYSTAPVAQVAMGLPAGIFFMPASQMMGVVDSGDNRILLFNSFDSNQWPLNVTNSPVATAVLGQTGYTANGANGGTANYVPAPSASTLNRPTAAVYGAGQLFVADTLNNRVLTLPFTAGAFSAATQVLGQLNFAMSAPNLVEGREFNFFPNSSGSAADAGVAIDTGSAVPHLYVSDPNNHRVLGFKDFRSLAAGSPADIVIGQKDFNSVLCNMTGNPAAPTSSSLCYPTGLAVDPTGNLYVADSANSRVLRFPAPFAWQGTGPEPADLVLGQHQFTFAIPDPTSSTMKYPYGLALSDNNGLLVSDLADNRVLFFSFDPDSDTFAASLDNGLQATKVFGQQDFNSIGSGNGNNQFNAPHHIAVDNQAYLYVVDSGNNRVMVFNQVSGTNTPSTGAVSLFQINGLSTPRGIWVNPITSEIWVADNSGTVKKYPYLASLETENPATTSGVVGVPSAALALTQDQFGDLIVADATNRVGFYFPAADAINGGNFLPSCIGGSSSTCRPLAPGTLAALCSQGSVCAPGFTLQLFGPATAANTSLANPYPMPTVLGDMRVDMSWTNSDGSTTTQSTPLYYVSPTQINFVVPMGAPSTGVANLAVVQNSTSRIYAAGQVQMAAFSPAILELEYTGSLRQAAAVNLADGTVNSTTNKAARGTYISIYATGQGYVPGAPPDGAAVTTPVPAPVPLQVNINGLYLSQMTYDPSSDIPQSQWIQYSGLSSFPGLWQINVYIPHAVPPGTQIPLIIVTEGEPNTAPGTYVTYINVK